jgi:hypothetical protein
VSDEPRGVDNIEIAQRMIAGFLVADFDTVFAQMTPRVEFENRTGAPGLDGTYVGREEIMGMLAKLNEAF